MSQRKTPMEKFRARMAWTNLAWHARLAVHAEHGEFDGRCPFCRLLRRKTLDLAE